MGDATVPVFGTRNVSPRSAGTAETLNEMNQTRGKQGREGGRDRNVPAKNIGRNWKISGSPHLLPTLYLVNASTLYAQMAILLLLGQTSVLLML